MINFESSSVGFTKLTALTTGSVLILAIGYFLINKTRKFVFEPVGRVSKLILYPIKSCLGVEVNETMVTRLGLQCGPFRDRAWVILDAKNEPVSIFNCKQLVFIQPAFDEDYLVLTSTHNKDLEPLRVRVRDNLLDSDEPCKFEIFGDAISGVDCGEEVGEWLLKVLGLDGCKLIQYLDSFEPRSSNSFGFRNKKFERNYPILYQGKSSLLINTTGSLADLNQKIAINSGPDAIVPVDRFRPNILIENTIKDAWDEDKWFRTRINDEVQLTQVLTCERCAMTTISREEGQRGREPLFTLRKFRCQTDKKGKKLTDAPQFGAIFGVDVQGAIKIGDQVDAVRMDIK